MSHAESQGVNVEPPQRDRISADIEKEDAIVNASLWFNCRLVRDGETVVYRDSGGGVLGEPQPRHVARMVEIIVGARDESYAYIALFAQKCVDLLTAGQHRLLMAHGLRRSQDIQRTWFLLDYLLHVVGLEEQLQDEVIGLLAANDAYAPFMTGRLADQRATRHLSLGQLSRLLDVTLNRCWDDARLVEQHLVKLASNSDWQPAHRERIIRFLLDKTERKLRETMRQPEAPVEPPSTLSPEPVPFRLDLPVV